MGSIEFLVDVVKEGTSRMRIYDTFNRSMMFTYQFITN